MPEEMNHRPHDFAEVTSVTLDCLFRERKREMSDPLTDRARKAAEEAFEYLHGAPDIQPGESATDVSDRVQNNVAAIFELHMQMAMDEQLDVLARHAEDISKRYARCDLLEQALSDAYAKLDEAKRILRKVL